MRLPTDEKLEPVRKPDNREEIFADGDFGDFIKPIVDTLDPYHTEGVDPRAIAIALRNLAQNDPDAQMEMRSMEKRGNNFLIRLATSPEANRSQLNEKYFKYYNETKQLSEIEKATLSGKNEDTKIIENSIYFVYNRNTLNVETYINQGDTMSDKSGGLHIGSIGGDATGLAGGDINGVAGKDMTGVAGGDIGQLAKSEALESPKLTDLLQQLQSAIKSDAQLAEKDKAKALKQVKALEEASQNPNDEDKKDLADTAITMLKGILSGIPAIATCVKAS